MFTLHTSSIADTILLVALSGVLVVLGLLVLGMRVDGRFARRRREQEELARKQWTRSLADASFDGLLIHRQGLILQMNRALVRMLGAREREWIGQHFGNLAAPRDAAALRAELEAPQPQLFEFLLLRADKSEVPVEICSQTIEFDGAPATVMAIRDISQKRADTERILRLMHFDALTGLPNRKLFHERLAAVIVTNDRHGGCAAILTIDCDQFKALNEQLGRAGGDILLRQIAARLAGLAAREDFLARIGGDKFALLIMSEGAPSRALHQAAQVEAAFNEPFIIEGHLVKASVSIGVALYPEHAADSDALMKASDLAMRLAHRAGGGQMRVVAQDDCLQSRQLPVSVRENYRGPMNEAQRLTADLRLAVGRGEISLLFQPVFDAASAAPLGFEALARWNHKQIGLIMPDQFIPLAEEAGLIHEIGGYVLESAALAAVESGTGLKMALNVSALQLRDQQFPDRVAAILNKTGLKPAQLELEVTESLLIENRAAAAEALHALRAIGVSLALDDFGTGYSSLSYLCDFPFARLKIDKRFIQALGGDANAAAIVKTILTLAENLRLDVTAEGVETEAQLEFLRSHHCQAVQGFLLGRPQARAVPPARRVVQVKPSLVVNRG